MEDQVENESFKLWFCSFFPSTDVWCVKSVTSHLFIHLTIMETRYCLTHDEIVILQGTFVIKVSDWKCILHKNYRCLRPNVCGKFKWMILRQHNILCLRCICESLCNAHRGANDPCTMYIMLQTQQLFYVQGKVFLVIRL